MKLGGKAQLGKVLTALRREELRLCFDARAPGSRPSANQQQVLDDISDVRHRYVVAANQCLAKGTLVATPTGPKPIEEIRVGDFVYSEHGEPIKVLKTFQNGIKEVFPLKSRGRTWVEATKDHVFLCQVESGKQREIKVKDFPKACQIIRRHVRSELGRKDIPYAYSLGAFTGDGCCMEKSKKVLVYSSANPAIVKKIAEELGGTYKKNHPNNYNWHILADRSKIPLHMEWLHGRYAHEKIADLEEIKTWNRQSCVQYLAGLFDSDGSMAYSKSAKAMSWQVGMQAKSVINAVEYLLLALWGVKSSTAIDARSKYKNGPIYTAVVRSPHEIKRIMDELGPHVLSEQKQWKEKYNELGNRSFSDRQKLSLGKTGRLEETFDLHVESSTNLYLLANGLVTHNSGKSALGAREAAWLLTETHPTWTRPAEWGKEPLQMLIIGRTDKIVQNVLWQKISGYLEGEELKIVKSGSSLEKVIHVPTGNHIIFFSHHDIKAAREKVQGFVAHWAWIDEMPASMAFIKEVQMRVHSNRGYFLTTFTPLIKNDAIRKLVDGSEAPLAKKYQFNFLDNPLNAGREEEILAEYAHLPKAMIRTRLYGDWSTGEGAVYYFDPEIHVRQLPATYSPAWPHIESVDPASNSKLGYTLYGQDPATGIWYCVRSDYVEDLFAPTDILEAVKAKSEGYNIVKRICDWHESWYIGEAAKQKIYYELPQKRDRKQDLIAGLQEVLGKSLFITPACEDLTDEFVSCTRSEDGTRIINASSYHLLDTAQYFVDLMPKKLIEAAPTTWHEELRKQNEKWQAKQAALTAKNKYGKKAQRWLRGGRTRRFA
jgi:phage terminase large subunit-like protein